MYGVSRYICIVLFFNRLNVFFTVPHFLLFIKTSQDIINNLTPRKNLKYLVNIFRAPRQFSGAYKVIVYS